MILNSFEMKFHDKNEGMPPRACILPPKKIKNLTGLVFNHEPDQTRYCELDFFVDRVGPAKSIPAFVAHKTSDNSWPRQTNSFQDQQFEVPSASGEGGGRGSGRGGEGAGRVAVRPPARPRGLGGAAPQEKEKESIYISAGPLWATRLLRSDCLRM